MRRTIEAIFLAIVLSLLILNLFAWLASRIEQHRMQSTLAAQKLLLDSANTREELRNSALKTTLAQLDKLKRAKQTPEQIIQTLSHNLPLPQPITLSESREISTPATHDPKITANSQNTSSDSPYQNEETTPAKHSPSLALDLGAQIPEDDLKPLYNYVQDSRACQERLTVSTQNAADDSHKVEALTRERNAAITAAKGGSFLRRLRQDTIWLAFGAVLELAVSYHL